MAQKIWFITGASRGFGRLWAEAALARGDKVAVTARSIADVEDFAERFEDRALPIALDVTNRTQVGLAVARAHTHFGRLDILLNNAGYALVGAIEEGEEADVRAEFDTNYFGTLAVIQAALPLLREQGGGHILGVSSVAGVIAHGMIGFYHASKWAFEALHEALADEVKAFGIKVTILEPGAYATSFSSPTSLRMAKGLDAYAPHRAQLFAAGAQMPMGDPHATADAILKIVDAADPPLRFFVGTEGLPLVRAAFAARLATWEAWEELSTAAQGVSITREVEV